MLREREREKGLDAAVSSSKQSWHIRIRLIAFVYRRTRGGWNLSGISEMGRNVPDSLHSLHQSHEEKQSADVFKGRHSGSVICWTPED